VAAHPYVANLLARLERQRSDLDRAKRRGARGVDTNSPTAREILRHLEFAGPRSVRRLSQELGLDPTAVAAFVNAFVRKGRLLVQKARGARGGRVTLV
jgi:DNA-binding MarR family transcriptional regulator